MNEEARLLLNVWVAISDWISGGDKQDAADALIESFVESGHEVELLYDVDGECPYLDRALATAAAEHNEGDPLDEDDEGY